MHGPGKIPNPDGADVLYPPEPAGGAVRCGRDVPVESLTDGRVTVGPGTLYHLLDEFLTAGMIEETKAEGRRRSYRITPAGQSALEAEYRRLRVLVTDYEACIHQGGSAE